MAYNVWTTDEYRQIWDGCKRLHAIIIDPKQEPAVVTSAVKALIDAIAFRREMRGIPRLASHKLNDLPIRRANKPKMLDAPSES